jgi:hypothetical protein
MNNKKRKKQFYANAAKKGKYGGGRKLSENMRGFLITVNNRFDSSEFFYCTGMHWIMIWNDTGMFMVGYLAYLQYK